MTVRSWDRAGNFTDIVRKVIVSLDHLQAPVLSSPACGTWINSLVTTFKWTPVSGAASYKFQLVYPNGNTLERSTTSNELQQTLSVQGEYRWRVASVDGSGNVGSYTEYCTLYLDRTPPVVSQFFITANNVPAQQQGNLYLGDFTVEVQFSEPLDTDYEVFVSFDPLGAIGAPAQNVTTSNWVNTDTSSNWTGSGNVPRTAKPAEWDGQVTFVVKGATDRAGNTMVTKYNSSFELLTGPWFETSFFSSLFNEDEFTMIVQSSVDLVQVPTISSMKGLTWQGSDQHLVALSEARKCSMQQ